LQSSPATVAEAVALRGALAASRTFVWISGTHGEVAQEAVVGIGTDAEGVEATAVLGTFDV